MFKKMFNHAPPYVLLDFIANFSKDEYLRSFLTGELKDLDIYQEFDGVYTVIGSTRFRFVKSDIDFSYNWSLKKIIVKELTSIFDDMLEMGEYCTLKRLFYILDTAYNNYLSVPNRVLEVEGKKFPFIELIYDEAYMLRTSDGTSIRNADIHIEEKDYICKYYFSCKMTEYFNYLNKLVLKFNEILFQREFYLKCFDLGLDAIAINIATKKEIKLSDGSYTIGIEVDEDKIEFVGITKHKDLPEGVKESTIYQGVEFAGAMLDIKHKLEQGVKIV